MSKHHQSYHRRRSTSVTESHLPDWIFDVDSDDDDDDVNSTGNVSLLSELEIDLQLVYDSCMYSILHPIRSIYSICCNRVNSNNSNQARLVVIHDHPLLHIYKSNAHIDFWGPCSVVTIYGAILWLGEVRYVAWIYMIWLFTSLFNHYVSKVWLANPSIMLHFSLLGYSLVALLPLVTCIVLFGLPLWLAYIFELFAVAYSSAAAYLAYRNICYNSSASCAPDGRVSLLLPPCILMNLYLVALLPLHKLS